MAKRVSSADFDQSVIVEHRPTGLRFFQRGGRIWVQRESMHNYNRVISFQTSFTTPDLQAVGSILSLVKLKAAAIKWLKENEKTEGVWVHG